LIAVVNPTQETDTTPTSLVAERLRNSKLYSITDTYNNSAL